MKRLEILVNSLVCKSLWFSGNPKECNKEKTSLLLELLKKFGRGPAEILGLTSEQRLLMGPGIIPPIASYS